MPLDLPEASQENRIAERLALKLSLDSAVNRLVTLPVRLYPPDTLDATDEVIVAIYTPDSVLGVSMDECCNSDRITFVLSVLAREQTGSECGYPPYEGAFTAGISGVTEADAPPGYSSYTPLSASYWRSINVAKAFVKALRRLRRDTTPGDSLWYALQFVQAGGSPNFLTKRLPSQHFQTLAHFEISTRS